MAGYRTLIKQTVMAIIIGSLLGWSGGFAVKVVPVHAFDVSITIAEGAEIIEVATAPDGYTLVTASVLIAPEEPTEWTTPDGDVTVELEAGTVEDYVELRYETLFEAQIPDLLPGFVATDTLFDLSLVSLDPESGETPVLLKAITITITLTQDVIAQAQENEWLLVILHYHDGVWTPLATSVDFENGKAQAQVDSLSIFALAYQADTHRSHVTVPSTLAFGDVFPGEMVPKQLTVALSDTGSSGAPAASYKISVDASGDLALCTVLPPPSDACLEISKDAGDVDAFLDTTACAKLTKGTDNSDSWIVTLHLPDDVSTPINYTTTIIRVDADDIVETGENPAEHGDPCS